MYKDKAQEFISGRIHHEKNEAMSGNSVKCSSWTQLLPWGSSWLARLARTGSRGLLSGHIVSK